MAVQIPEEIIKNISDQPFSGFSALEGSIKAAIERSMLFEFEFRQWVIERKIEYWQQEAIEAEDAIVTESVKQIFQEEKKVLIEETPALKNDEELDDLWEEFQRKISATIQEYSQGMREVTEEMHRVAKELGVEAKDVGNILAVIELSYWQSHPLLKSMFLSERHQKALEAQASLLPSPLVGSTQIVPQLTRSRVLTDKEEQEKQLNIQTAVKAEKAETAVDAKEVEAKAALKAAWTSLFPQIQNPSDKLLTLFDVGLRGVAQKSDKLCNALEQISNDPRFAVVHERVQTERRSALKSPFDVPRPQNRY